MLAKPQFCSPIHFLGQDIENLIFFGKQFKNAQGTLVVPEEGDVEEAHRDI